MASNRGCVNIKGLRQGQKYMGEESGGMATDPCPFPLFRAFFVLKTLRFFRETRRELYNMVRFIAFLRFWGPRLAAI